MLARITLPSFTRVCLGFADRDEALIEEPEV